MSKKAMSAEFLVGTIIVIVSFLFIGGAMANYLRGADEREVEALCQNSVNFRAASAISLAEDIEVRLSPLLCKTIDKEISGDRKEVQEVIANKMAKCWEMFGAGRYDTSIFEKVNLFGHPNNCFVCYVIPIEKVAEDEPERKKISSQEFDHYLQTKRIKGATYLDYIQYKSGGQGYVMTVLPEGITENSAYGIVYKGKKGKCEDCGWFTVGGAALALPALVVGAIGVPIGATIAGVIAIAAGTGVGLTIESVTAIVKDLLASDQAGIDGILLIDLQQNPKKGESSIASKVFSECNYIPDIAGK